jgi:hypothetical protein
MEIASIGQRGESGGKENVGCYTQKEKNKQHRTITERNASCREQMKARKKFFRRVSLQVVSRFITD